MRQLLVFVSLSLVACDTQSPLEADFEKFTNCAAKSVTWQTLLGRRSEDVDGISSEALDVYLTRALVLGETLGKSADDVRELMIKHSQEMLSKIENSSGAEREALVEEMGNDLIGCVEAA